MALLCQDGIAVNAQKLQYSCSLGTCDHNKNNVCRLLDSNLSSLRTAADKAYDTSESKQLKAYVAKPQQSCTYNVVRTVEQDCDRPK